MQLAPDVVAGLQNIPKLFKGASMKALVAAVFGVLAEQHLEEDVLGKVALVLSVAPSRTRFLTFVLRYPQERTNLVGLKSTC